MLFPQVQKINHTGFSLVEVMVAVAVMSILAAGLTTMISNQNKQIQNLQLAMNKNFIQAIIEKDLSDPGVLQYSWKTSPLNAGTSFATCLLPGPPIGGPGPCNTTGPTPNGFILVDPVTKNEIAGPLGGGAATAVYYEADGSWCGVLPGGATAKCPFQVTVGFWADCPGAVGTFPGNNCGGQGYTYELFYDIKQAFVAPGATTLKEICTMYPGAPAVCAQPPISYYGPYSGTTGLNPHITFWTSGSTIGYSSLTTDNGAVGPTGCTNLQDGQLRSTLVTNPQGYPGGNYQRLEVCNYRIGAGAYQWTYVSGPPNSGNLGAGLPLANKALMLPMIPGMYLCPVGQGVAASGATLAATTPGTAIPLAEVPNQFACGGMPACHGQIQSEQKCCVWKKFNWPPAINQNPEYCFYQTFTPYAHPPGPYAPLYPLPFGQCQTWAAPAPVLPGEIQAINCTPLF